MKEEYVKYTCDMCTNNVTVPKGVYAGTFLESQWVRLYIKLKPIDIQKTKLHFCGTICAEKFLHLKNEQSN